MINLLKKIESLKKNKKKIELDIKVTNDDLKMVNKNIEQLSDSQEFIDMNKFLDYLLSEAKYEKGVYISNNKGILEKISLLNSKFCGGNSFYLLDEAKEYEIKEGVSTYESIRHYMTNIVTKRFMTFLSSNITKSPINTTLLQAVLYCNKRSITEGLTPCYDIIDNTFTCDYSKNGYRLPSEKELTFIVENELCENFANILYNEIQVGDQQLPFLLIRVK